MNRGIILFIAGLFVIGVELTILFYYGYYLQEYQELSVDFSVHPGVVGLNADTDALHFGSFAPGSSSRRSVVVEPAHNGRLVITFTGNASPYLSVDPNDFSLSKGSQARLTFVAAAPDGTPVGNYTGKAKFSIYRR
jgi:hypothetical protein